MPSIGYWPGSYEIRTPRSFLARWKARIVCTQGGLIGADTRPDWRSHKGRKWTANELQVELACGRVAVSE